eukprot:m.146640 g.146640  ORF g.146640 m.146640 type:complete len:1346 (+) comp30487_c0_seq3:111-4148(+)
MMVTAMVANLNDFLAGALMREGLQLFEQANNPFVKQAVQNAFPEIPTDPFVIDFNDRIQTEILKRGKLREDLEKEKSNLESETDTEDKKIVKVRKKRIYNISKELEALAKQDQDESTKEPDPRWVRECRHLFGTSMKMFVNADNAWDTFMLVVVLRGFLPTVFKSTFADDFHAKDFLKGLENVVTARNDRAHRGKFIESDALDALSRIKHLLGQCKHTTEEEAVDTLLQESKRLVELAQSGAKQTTSTRSTLATSAAVAQTVYESLNDFEIYVESKIRRFEYKNGGIVFGKNLGDNWSDCVKSLNSQFKIVATLRHWYFHHIEGTMPDFNKCFESMQEVVSKIEEIEPSSNGKTWTRPSIPRADVKLTLKLSLPPNRMSIPVSKEGIVVGRDQIIAQVLDELMNADTSRVLLHGLPGIGKDTIALEVVHHDRLRLNSNGGLQLWLQASSDVVCMRQLVDFFATHRRRQVMGLEHDKGDEAPSLASIIKYLNSGTEQWVFVIEDLHTDSITALELLRNTKGHGRVLITSQASSFDRLPMSPIDVGRFDTDDSIELLRRMDIFGKKVAKDVEMQSESDLEATLVAAGLSYYPPPSPNEKSKDAKERHHKMQIALYQHRELNRPEFRTFLEEVGGNLPIAIANYGHILRADPTITSTLLLIRLINQIELDDVCTRGRNPRTDKHYFGFAKSVKFMLDRLFAQSNSLDAAVLLASLSVLDRSLTPTDLFMDHTRRALERAVGRHETGPFEQPLNFLGIFTNHSRLAEARDTLIERGFMQQSASGKYVGVLHQLVHRCVREHLAIHTTDGFNWESVVTLVQHVLVDKFPDDALSAVAVGRLYLASAQAWCALAVSPHGHIRVRVPFNVVLVRRLGQFLHVVENRFELALYFADAFRQVVELTLGSNHLSTAVAYDDLGKLYMSNGDHARAEGWFLKSQAILEASAETSSSYYHLAQLRSVQGRLDESLKLFHKVINVQEATPGFDPVELSKTYNSLAKVWERKGVFPKALEYHTKALNIRERCLGPNHPMVATTYNNIGYLCATFGEFDTAIGWYLKAVAAREATFGTDHPDTAESYGNLGGAYNQKEEYDTALEWVRKGLVIHEARLGPNHPDTAKTYGFLGQIFQSKGDPTTSIKWLHKAVAFQERTTPGIPDIAVTYTSLGTSYFQKGEHITAIEWFQKARAIYEKTFGTNHEDTAGTYVALAHAFLLTNDTKQAEHFSSCVLKCTNCSPLLHTAALDVRTLIDIARETNAAKHEIQRKIMKRAAQRSADKQRAAVEDTRDIDALAASINVSSSSRKLDNSTTTPHIAKSASTTPSSCSKLTPTNKSSAKKIPVVPGFAGMRRGFLC